MALIKTLGLRTAEFHQALARPDPAGAFGMEPITPEDIAEWVSNVRTQMDEMYTLLEAQLPRLPDAAQLIGNRPACSSAAVLPAHDSRRSGCARRR